MLVLEFSTSLSYMILETTAHHKLFSFSLRQIKLQFVVFSYSAVLLYSAAVSKIAVNR